MKDKDQSLDIEAFWEYDDPAVSEARFQDAMQGAVGDIRLELLTQVARTYGLRQEYARAHALLDQVESELEQAGDKVWARYLLERGRTYNSSGEGVKAKKLFEQAWEKATKAGLEGQAVDAAHMIAITQSGTTEGIEWNLRGLEIARDSQDQKARALIPAMLNNSAWDLHEIGRFEEALKLFEEAQAEWITRAKPTQIQVAKWSVARCLRSLGKFDKALQLQRELETEHLSAGTVDGYVYEEIAENLKALSNHDQAKGYFQKAYVELSQDDWFVQNEPDRLGDLKTQGGLDG